MATNSGFGFFPKDIEDPTGLLHDVFAETSDQKYGIGTKLTTWAEGKKKIYRYAKNGGTALTKALMCQGPAPIANHLRHVGGAGTTGAAKDKEIVVGTTMTTALTANQYDNGEVIINKVTGLNESYGIKSHTNTATPTIKLWTPIRTAIDTTSELTLYANRWNGVIVAPTTISNVMAGVPRIAVTASYYCWLQTGGECVLTVDTGDTSVVGERAGYPATIAVAGAVGLPAITDQSWGYFAFEAEAAETALVHLTIDS